MRENLSNCFFEYNYFRSSEMTDDEWEAKKCVEQGDIDHALAAYRRVHPISARILNIMGQLCTDKNNDYDCAFDCHMQALKMQDQV
jgi:hypothetical protein